MAGQGRRGARGLPRAELQIVGPTDARGAGGPWRWTVDAASARDWMVVRAWRHAAWPSGADPRGRAPAVDGRLHILVGERATPLRRIPPRMALKRIAAAENCVEFLVVMPYQPLPPDVLRAGFPTLFALRDKSGLPAGAQGAR